WTAASTGNIWGATTIAQGIVALGAANALPITTTVTLGQTGTSGALDLAGFNQQVSGLATAGSGGTITNSSVTSDSILTYNSASTSTFSGVIASGGTRNVALTISGGTLILTGANTYGGATNITSGLLQIGNGGASGSVGSGSISVGSGASIIFNRSSSLSVTNAIAGAGSIVQAGSATLT